MPLKKQLSSLCLVLLVLLFLFSVPKLGYRTTNSAKGESPSNLQMTVLDDDCARPEFQFKSLGGRHYEALTVYDQSNINQLPNFTLSQCGDPQKFPKHNDPWMSLDDRKLLMGQLENWKKKSKCFSYVEWGSGGSTFWALRFAISILSVENNPSWCHKMIEDPEVQCGIVSGSLVYICVDGGTVKNLGYPENTFKYRSSPYIDILDHFNVSPDFVLVDGRYRAAVALNAIKYLKEDSVMMIHDYVHRKQYWVVENFLDQIPRSISNSSVFGVFRKRKLIDNEDLLLQLDFLKRIPK